LRGSKALLLGALLLAGCSSSPPHVAPFKRARSFGYQLQNLKLSELAAAPFDILVIDYSRHGDEAHRFSPEDVARLQKGGRRVLAYLSIGEAEEYRYYWDPLWKAKPPPWLEKPNPDWPGNLKVRYWDPAWKAILYGSPDSYLDKIIDAGFDGVYLDIVDAYYYFGQQGRATAKEEMVRLVLDLADHARRTRGRPEFGVFPQNAESLLEDPRYLEAVSGIGHESTYYGYSGVGKETPGEMTLFFERLLDLAATSGRPVLNVDYTSDPAQMAAARKRAGAKGYLEYCAPKALDRLVPQK